MQMVGWSLAHLHLLGKQRCRACVASPCAATVSASIDRSAGQFAAAILGTGRHIDERRAKRRTQPRIAGVPFSIAPNAASSKAAPGGIVPSARKRKGPRAKAHECWFCHARLIEQVRVVSGPTPTSDEGGCSPLLPSGNSLRGAFVVRCRRPTDSCPPERSARQGPREAGDNIEFVTP